MLNGSFNCTQALAKRWIADKQGGNVLNIVTTYAAANCGSAFVVPSACAKAGVLAMTTSLAVEWAKYKIRLNAIAPGPFPTEGAWSRLMPSKQFEDHARDSHPMKRFGRHDELTNLAAFLLSDMSQYINGECVVIDGALWLRGAGEFNDLLQLPDSRLAVHGVLPLQKVLTVTLCCRSGLCGLCFVCRGFRTTTTLYPRSLPRSRGLDLTPPTANAIGPPSSRSCHSDRSEPTPFPRVHFV